MSETVSIINPLAGGARYTSRKRAEHFVRRGAAAYTPAGALRFIDQGKRLEEEHAREASEREIQAGKKVFVWSGARKGSHFSERESTPGVSRS